MEIVSTVHKSNKNICLRSEVSTTILVTRLSMMFEDLTQYKLL